MLCHEIGLVVDKAVHELLAGLYEAPAGPRLAVAGRSDGAAEVANVEVP